MDGIWVRVVYGGTRPGEAVKAGRGKSDFSLPRKALLSADGDLRGARVRCREGTLWLTQEGDFRDHILREGKELVLSRKGTVLVESLRDALFSITFGEHE